MSAPFGVPVLAEPVAMGRDEFALVRRGIAALWQRIVATDPGAGHRPLLLSYDVHPTPEGPVLIEVNTNAGGIATALQAARTVNRQCPEAEQQALRSRLVQLFQRDLFGAEPGFLAIVDDELAVQPLRDEMHAIAALLRPHVDSVRVIDASELSFGDGRLRHRGKPVDAVYWRSTDFLLDEPRHAAILRAVQEGTTQLAPSPQAYKAIADKRRFIDWSRDALLSVDSTTRRRFTIAETHPLSSRPLAEWWEARRQWVFKPSTGYGSRGVYVGKSISRRKLEALKNSGYLAQRYAPHPVLARNGADWKYDLRFYADRGDVIAATARIFQGQVVGMQKNGSGFAPVQVGSSCCLVGALAEAA